MRKVNKFLIKYWYLFLIFFYFLYYSWLMQMFPWEKQKLKCELQENNITIYNVPKNIDLQINGWGSGKFTNNQHFGTRSFDLRTNGNKYSKLLENIFGTYNYIFEIHVKEDHVEYKYGGTHHFSIPKKKPKLIDKNGKKIELNFRWLILFDYAYDGNEDPIAIWECYDE